MYIITRDGKDTINIYKKAIEINQLFDVVMLDLTIPAGMGGKDTLAKLKEINPNIISILASGSAVDYRTIGFNEEVSKPFTLESLFKILSKYLPVVN